MKKSKLKSPYTRPFDDGYDWRLVLLSVAAGLAAAALYYFLYGR